jgi:hypothetical protein
VDSIKKLFIETIEDAIRDALRGGKPLPQGIPGILVGPRAPENFSDFGDKNETDWEGSVTGIGNVTFAIRNLKITTQGDCDGSKRYRWTAEIVVYDEVGLSNRNGRWSGPVERLIYPPRRIIRGAWPISGEGTW